jgi:hypothetical protein
MAAAPEAINPSENVPYAGPSRGLATMAFVVISIVMVGSIVWRPVATSPYGDYFTLCGFKNLTGLPCPGCGLTHSFCALTKGEVETAFAFNLLGPAMFALMLLVWVRSVAVLSGRIGFADAFDRAMERFFIVKRLAIAFLVFGVARIVYVLIFHSESFRSSPVLRFVSRVFN